MIPKISHLFLFCFFRGHGNSTTIDDTDLSATTLANDICDVIEIIVDGFGDQVTSMHIC